MVALMAHDKQTAFVPPSTRTSVSPSVAAMMITVPHRNANHHSDTGDVQAARLLQSTCLIVQVLLLLFVWGC